MMSSNECPPTSGNGQQPTATNWSVPIGLRMFASCSQGGRKYMEDNYDIKYQFNGHNELQYIYLAIFDGHGGDVAAKFSKQHLCHNIVRQRAFWSKTSDDDILQAIKKGFVRTHYDMKKEVLDWPKTASGLPSTSGTTASIVFIMNGKYYTGHVGDSRIVLGRKHESTGKWMSSSLTRDHKPESPREKRRIEAAGGQVMNKSGVERVVWNRPKPGHKGPVRRSTGFDQIPFLAVARSLGDLWSFNSELNTYIVSPEPDVKCIPIDGNDMCLLLASDGLWNMMTTQTAVRVMQEVEDDQYSPELLEAVFGTGTTRLSPSRALVHFCLNRWYQSRFRADNTTVLAVMIEDNQGVPLIRSDQTMPMSALFSDSEEEDSDDGYYETFDNNDYGFGQTYDCLRNNFINNSSDLKLKTKDNSSAISSTTTFFNNSSNASIPENSNNKISSSTRSSAELSSDTLNPIPFDGQPTVGKHLAVVDHSVLTPLSNVSPNFDSISDNLIDKEDPTTPKTTISATVEPNEDSLDGNDSSRDSGNASPPTPLAINPSEELTDEEYASLPSLVNLSQNELDLYVVIDPKTLSVHSTDLNAVSIAGEENKCVDECQSSLANINKVIEDTNSYIFGKSTAYLRQTTNANDFMLNPNDNFWSESNPYYTLTAIKPRTSLPLSYVDNHCSPDLSNGCSPLIAIKDRASAPLSDNSLCIFGALKTCANINTNNSLVNHSSGAQDSSLTNKLSKVLANCSPNHSIKPKASSLRADIKKNRSIVYRGQNGLLRRLGLSKVSVHRMSVQKRKYSPDYSPPSKHLRSSLWNRKPLATKEHIMQMSFTRSLKQLAVGRLTRTRLRPIKLIKSYNKK